MIPGHYELIGKLNYWKGKYKEDISKLNIHIKKQDEIIEKLKERNKGLRKREMYQIWLEERKRFIKKCKENDKLLDEINELRIKRLANVDSILLVGTVDGKIEFKNSIGEENNEKKF